MPFHFQKISDYGTNLPVVARTFVQGTRLMQSFPISEDTRKAVGNVLFEVQRHLVRCYQVHEKVSGEVAAGIAQGFTFQSNGMAASLPGVADLEGHADSFLQSAKLAIRDSARALNPLYPGASLDHRLDKALGWARRNLPPDDPFTNAIAHYEPMVRDVIRMRNAVDHPEDAPGKKLVVHNFRLAKGEQEHQLIPPTWNLLGEQPALLADDMNGILNGILGMCEDLLAVSLLRLPRTIPIPIVIEEIPEAQRDPKCPMRLRVGLAMPFEPGPPSRGE